MVVAKRSNADDINGKGHWLLLSTDRLSSNELVMTQELIARLLPDVTAS